MGHFSRFGAHLPPGHFSRLDPKAPHFSRKDPPVLPFRETRRTHKVQMAAAYIPAKGKSDDEDGSDGGSSGGDEVDEGDGGIEDGGDAGGDGGGGGGGGGARVRVHFAKCSRGRLGCKRCGPARRDLRREAAGNDWSSLANSCVSNLARRVALPHITCAAASAAVGARRHDALPPPTGDAACGDARYDERAD